MGLGKTPTTLAALEGLRERGTVTKPILVVALATLKSQWASEVAKFTDRKSIIIEGTPKQRAALYARARRFSYVIVNYEQVVSDWKLLKEMDFSAIVCDEASALKNFRAQRTRRIKALASGIPVRFALTGTPIENGAAEELFSIMEFVDRKVLGDFRKFDERYITRNSRGWVEGYRNLHELHESLATAMVRRTQTEPAVAPYLPETIYRPPVMVKFDRAGRDLYRRVVHDVVEALIALQESGMKSFSIDEQYGRKSKLPTAQDRILAAATARIAALRQVCVDPQVLQASAVNFFDEEIAAGGKYAAQLLGEDAFSGVTRAPKLDAVIKYTADHLSIDPTYKVIIFVTWVDAVETLVRRFRDAGIGAVPYTGQLSTKEKDKNKSLFQEKDDVRVFVSSDAGGYGVNLPQANLLINVDLPWSSGALKQRNGRVQRASSEWKTVVVQDFLMEDSIDLRQHAVVHQKTAVASAILDKEGVDEAGELALTVHGLLQFLTQAIN